MNVYNVDHTRMFKCLAEMEQLFEEDKKKKELAKAQETATPEYAIGLTTPAEVGKHLVRYGTLRYTIVHYGTLGYTQYIIAMRTNVRNYFLHVLFLLSR